MKRINRAVLLLATLAACGGGGGGSAGGGGNLHVDRVCNFSSQGTCAVVSGTAAVLDSDNMTQAECVATGGTYGGSCAATDRAGQCTVQVSVAAGTYAVVETYYASHFTDAAAQQACADLGGTFTPGDLITRSCDFPADDLCDVVTGRPAALDAVSFTSTACANGGGTYGAVCSATGRVGRCAFTTPSPGGQVTVLESLYSPTYDATSASQACATLGGTFTAD